MPALRSPPLSGQPPHSRCSKQCSAPLPVRVVRADALRMDWAELLGPEPGWVLVANLPYNIATPLVATVLDQVPGVDRLVIMVQREVADRLVALPGHREYGAVSVKVAYWAEATLVGNVPPTVFVPRPKVDSALVSIRRRALPAVDPDKVEPELLFQPGAGRVRQAAQDAAPLPGRPRPVGRVRGG